MEVELIDRLRAQVAAAPFPATWLPPDPVAAERLVGALRLSADDPLATWVRAWGGLVLDGGWLRVLGSGHPELPRALDDWNLEREPALEGGLLIADDVLGGFFARMEATGTVHYLAPDTMEWEDLEVDLEEWLEGMLSERLTAFYSSLRWEGWERAVRAVDGASGLHRWPPLWAADAEAPSWRTISMDELWSFQLHMVAQLADVPDGGEVEVEVDD